eukprot:1712757-Amphidinium_carterae.1
MSEEEKKEALQQICVCWINAHASRDVLAEAACNKIRKLARSHIQQLSLLSGYGGVIGETP